LSFGFPISFVTIIQIHQIFLVNTFYKYFAYCGCAAGALSFFLFVILPTIIYVIFPQLAAPVEQFIGNIAEAIHLGTIISYTWLPLLGFLVVGVPLIALSPLWLGYLNDSRKISRLKQVGVKGTATVVAIHDAAITINNNPYVTLTVEIKGFHSKVEMSMLVSRINLPRIGETIDVFYDPSDLKVVMPASRIQSQ
jgi:hypothetical protein